MLKFHRIGKDETELIYSHSSYEKQDKMQSEILREII